MMRFAINFLLILFAFYLSYPSYSMEGDEKFPALKSRIIARVKIYGFSDDQIQMLSATVERANDVRVIEWAERKIVEGRFKGKHPAIILKTVTTLIEDSEWVKSVLPECFNPLTRTAESIAIYYASLALESGLRREMFEFLCRNMSQRKIQRIQDFINFVKMGAAFSKNGISFDAVKRLLQEVPLETFSHFHFFLVGKMTILGIQQGLNPYEAIEETRKIINLKRNNLKKIVPLEYEREKVNNTSLQEHPLPEGE